MIDRQGRIAARRRGPVDEEFMRARVEPLLRERRETRSLAVAGAPLLALAARGGRGGLPADDASATWRTR